MEANLGRPRRTKVISLQRSSSSGEFVLFLLFRFVHMWNYSFAILESENCYISRWMILQNFQTPTIIMYLVLQQPRKLFRK